MSKKSREWQPRTNMEPGSQPDAAKALEPPDAAYGVVCMRDGNTLSWARVRIDKQGVCIVDDEWQQNATAWHRDVGELGIGRVEEAAVKSTMRREYGGPH